MKNWKLIWNCCADVIAIRVLRPTLLSVRVTAPLPVVFAVNAMAKELVLPVIVIQKSQSTPKTRKNTAKIRVFPHFNLRQFLQIYSFNTKTAQISAVVAENANATCAIARALVTRVTIVI